MSENVKTHVRGTSLDHLSDIVPITKRRNRSKTSVEYFDQQQLLSRGTGPKPRRHSCPRGRRTEGRHTPEERRDHRDPISSLREERGSQGPTATPLCDHGEK
ncbi:hypothetical protein KUCAC02_024825 [Chaenocephalus aceratus]|nr:hypothetical protein KUCAC02_024825 [Chaenocephalus aceratus]